jgi:hypothetical protein
MGYVSLNNPMTRDKKKKAFVICFKVQQHSFIFLKGMK